MARFDLMDFEWAGIQPRRLSKPRGVPRVDDRRVLNGIFWRLRTGAPWAYIPERYGPHTTCANCFNRWRKAGVWDRLQDAASKAYDGDIRMIDSPAASACTSTPPTPKKDDRSGCMGRPRGGLTTKIHALVDAEGLLIALKLTEGQAHDGRSARDMLDALVEGQTLLADRAYDSDELRRSLDERGAWANIKPMPNRKNVPAFSPFLYRYRNLVERFFNKIKHYRAVAT